MRSADSFSLLKGVEAKCVLQIVVQYLQNVWQVYLNKCPLSVHLKY